MYKQKYICIVIVVLILHIQAFNLIFECVFIILVVYNNYKKSCEFNLNHRSQQLTNLFELRIVGCGLSLGLVSSAYINGS